MTADSTYMSASVKSFPYSFSDKSQLKDEIIIKDDELTYDEKCHNLGVYCYNPKYHEVCAKISLFYFVWFMLLAGIFASLLGIFMAIIDKRIPTFRGNSSALALDTYNLNPGTFPIGIQWYFAYEALIDYEE
ncbi:unnamed protein product [Didymodactylos carnosus]|uniref:Uncharacterized protein n=1 Tax=Didymodactylos carnosus TaxID=1234261 RepID=A0A8S2DBN7_9BILA|nr:unnamed protein product [Didymodactylos carnosus]CAF3698547.1 unnamed protein product [Didymodactylos carnosus]